MHPIAQMNADWLDSGIRQIACASIAGYQKHISPRKGFSCAHRLLYGGESCSQYVKRTIAYKGLLAAIEASRQRFQACKEANRILSARIENSESEDEAKREQTKENNTHKQDRCLTDAGWSCVECGAEGINCDGLVPCDLPSCDLPDCSFCTSGIDCSAVDCGSGLDCGSACGSCSF